MYKAAASNIDLHDYEEANATLVWPHLQDQNKTAKLGWAKLGQNYVNVHAPAKHRRKEVEVDNDVNVHAQAKHHVEEGPKAGSSGGAKRSEGVRDGGPEPREGESARRR